MAEPSTSLDALRARIRRHRYDSDVSACDLVAATGLSAQARRRIVDRATDLINSVRACPRAGLMEVFLGEYGLSTKEGVALMCLAEALLRVPDSHTIDALIEDKIAPSDWGRHLGQSSSPLVNASTWALLLTGKVLAETDDRGLANVLRGVIKRLGEPAIRAAVARAMRELGRQFVLGRTIDEGMARAAAMEAQGFTYSYDMLGEAACTEADAARYHEAYSAAIGAIAKGAQSRDIRVNPGISVKLSALHPRYEEAKRGQVSVELADRVSSLARLAKSAGTGFNIDAEEADRLELSLDVIEVVLSDRSLAGWDGFGVVVQAYCPRASFIIDWLYALAGELDRRIMVRLVKGAYWDTEIKHAQVLGVGGFPAFTRKSLTDVSYIGCARKLLSMCDRIYPQFATHNAHTIASVLEIAQDLSAFEFQRLHGMGEALHTDVMGRMGTRHRIYAPVGAHRDLLAYLVRRLLENGANSSFVHQIVNMGISVEEIAADPVSTVEALGQTHGHPAIVRPPNIFEPGRRNSRGFNLADRVDLDEIEEARAAYRSHQWEAFPTLKNHDRLRSGKAVLNPASTKDIVGHVDEANLDDVAAALARASEAAAEWKEISAPERAALLRTTADLYEANAGELFALAAREAGKTLPDCISEVREAVDFLRYYASQIEHHSSRPPLGIVACISPWNFPLAIFTGQIAAALVTGNVVIAKPAEQTPLIAARAVSLFHEAGIPTTALQLVPGEGSVVGAALTSDSRVGGVCFTGSTDTARTIDRSMARALSPAAPLIAETGGINAMIVDSTALPEQAVRDIMSSAFQSAGQRCSALRVLCVQADIADDLERMLIGAMDELSLGDPWNVPTDIGPVIDDSARAHLSAYVDAAAAEGRLLKRLKAPDSGRFVGPALIRIESAGDLEEEIFGPVLHVLRFNAADITSVIEEINSLGYGLTFGLHTRIDDRVQEIVRRIRVGNIYVNRNQIGAVVGSQPFGGEALSGTGPKAGGPNYLSRFLSGERRTATLEEGPEVPLAKVQSLLDSLAGPRDLVMTDYEELPGPTGEVNRLFIHPRGKILCLGPTQEVGAGQARRALESGCSVLLIVPGAEDIAKEFSIGPGQMCAHSGNLAPTALAALRGVDAVALWADEEVLRPYRIALSDREGPIIPLIAEMETAFGYTVERHLCIDTTAAGGNPALMARVE